MQIALGVFAWWLIGAGALDGDVQPGWLLAWVLLSLSALFVQLFASFTGGLLTIDVAALSGFFYLRATRRGSSR
ncbi:hypothetical protein WME73_11855 [Sorangium sp. So ce302]|uniref:hypothetical protein n=1 Tax=Sorangium sp. So ce302 TaxID=3133297 RepID=UPI003F6408AF